MEFASLSDGLFAYAVWLMLGCLLATFACALVAMAKHYSFSLHRKRQLFIQDQIRQMMSQPVSLAARGLQETIRSMQQRYPIDTVWAAVQLVEALPEVQRADVVDALPDLFSERAVRACFASPRIEDRVIALEAIGLGRIQVLEPAVLVGLEEPELAPFAAVALCRLASQGAFHRVMALHGATRITNSQALAALARLGHDDRQEGFATMPDHPLYAYFEPSRVFQS